MLGGSIASSSPDLAPPKKSCSRKWWKTVWRSNSTIKGIVHPKMKSLSSSTHPQVVPNLYECLCSAEHKGRYSEECGKQSSSGAPLTSIVFFSFYGSQWCPKSAWLQNFFKISSIVFGRTKTFIQVWNYLRVSKWWQNFHFWVNYPFKYYIVHSLCNMFQQCISNIYNVFTNNSQNWLYTDFKLLQSVCIKFI